MDAMVGKPGSLKELVEADLRRAARLVVKIQDEIDPQVRIGTPEGDYHIAVTLPNDAYGRTVILRNLSLLMAWKQAFVFTLASELIEPDSVYCLGVTYKESHACLARIRREPRPWTGRNFGPVEWLTENSIDPLLMEMLPKGGREITSKEMGVLEKWFGARGRFPAVRIETGELGL
jgi:hypothetical protein